MPVYDLSWDDSDAWIRDHDLGWKRFLKKAAVGTDKDTVKNRWNVNLGQGTKDKIRATLEAMEAEKPTPTGRRIHGLEEWIAIGEVLSREPEIFEAQLALLRRIAEPLRARQELAKRKAELDAEIASHMPALATPTAKTRK